MIRKIKLFHNIILLLVLFSGGNIFAQKNATAKIDTIIWNDIKFQKYIIHYTDSDAGMFMSLKTYLDQGISTVEKYFGKKFPKSFDVYIYPKRSDMDKAWQKAWGIPGFKSQCWMVASGVADKLDILSPSVWKSEACEHNPEDKTATKDLIAHELVHVYQGQVNRNPDFAGMDNIGWFIEGLAVFVSGQLTKDRIDRAVKAIKMGDYPRELKNAWSGANKYGFSGLLVSYISSKYGKDKITELLTQSTQKGILSMLNVTEQKLLNYWKNWVLKQR
jgi:hypothetical protein